MLLSKALVVSTRTALRAASKRSPSAASTRAVAPSIMVMTGNQLLLSVQASNNNQCTIAWFSSDGSHSDFGRQQKQAVSDDSDKVQEMIKQHVTDNPIMLYMKGNPSMPMCGFSSRVVQILKEEKVDFSSVNVLDYPSIREGVKKYSDWPTIPQLYVNGEFIGGCDIVTSMHESGELTELLKEAKEASAEK